jgi:hypothetical protein
MRFMVGQGHQGLRSRQDALSEEQLSAMAKFNEEMVKAGVMLDANGLQPSPKGARVLFSGVKRTVIDGPWSPATRSSGQSRRRGRSNGSSAAPIRMRGRARSKSAKFSS